MKLYKIHLSLLLFFTSSLSLTVSGFSLLDFVIDKEYQIEYRVIKRLFKIRASGDVESKTVENEFFLESTVTMKKQSNGFLKCNMTAVKTKAFVLDEDLSKPFLGNVSSSGELDTFIDEGTSIVSSDIKRHFLMEFFKD